jgi:hypothetical protein
LASSSSRRRSPLNTANRARENEQGEPTIDIEARRDRNLFEELMAVRDQQREQRNKSVWIIRGRDVPWEVSRLGKIQWYLHPLLNDTVLRTLIFYRQELAPGSRSGRQKCQGSIMMFVLEGRGYTSIDGIKHSWKAGDLVNLPIREEGIVVQHFNTDSEKRALFIACEPNFVDSLGVDKGCGYELLEAAPEWREQQDRSAS